MDRLREDFAALLAVRGEVLRVLEEARTAKLVSNKAAETPVSLSHSAGEAMETSSLPRYEAALPELFGVALVVLSDSPDGARGGEPAYRVAVSPAPGLKCERCWRFTEDVGAEEQYPTVCVRCAEALRAIGFMPYPVSAAEPTALGSHR